jgi:hypothetical protein
MKKKNSLVLISLIIMSLYSCRNSEKLLLVGIDEEGRDLEVKVDKDTFLKSSAETFSSLNDSTIEMLDASADASWKIDKVEVGVGVNLTAGVGQLWKWSYNPGFKLIYQKQN